MVQRTTGTGRVNGKGKGTPSGARNGLELLSLPASPQEAPAIRFGQNAHLINAKSAIRKSGEIAGRERLRDRDGPFAQKPHCAMLRGRPDHAPAWAFCPTISTSSQSPDRRRGRKIGIPSRLVVPLRAKWLFPPSCFDCGREGSGMWISGRLEVLRRRQGKRLAVC